METVKKDKGITYTEIAKQMSVSREQLYYWMGSKNRLPKLQFYGICRLYFSDAPMTIINIWYSRICDEIENGGTLECLKRKKQ